MGAHQELNIDLRMGHFFRLSEYVSHLSLSAHLKQVLKSLSSRQS